MNVLLLLISAVFSQALSPNQALYMSSNLDSFMEARSEWVEIVRMKEGCQWEMDEEQFPFRCLKYLQWQLRVPQELENLRSLRQEINQSCIKTVNQVASIDPLISDELLSLVGSECHKAIKARVLDLEYIQQSLAGSDLEIQNSHERDTSKETHL